MPFQSEAQRRYLWANNPEVARKWENKYANGGDVMPGLLDRKNEDVTITRKMPNGASVTYKSPQDSQMDLNGILGGMVEGYTPTPVSDNKQIMVTPGEYVVNHPAAQKYKGLLEKINNEGRQMLARGGWTQPRHMKRGYAEGGDPYAGYADYSQQDFIDESQPKDTQGGGGAYGAAGHQQAGQQYPPTVVLDPNSSGKHEFDRMDQLVRNGIYTIKKDRAGRAVYILTNLGKSHNVRATGSGQQNVGVDTSNLQPRDQYSGYSGVSADPVGDNQLAQWTAQGGGRGNVVEQPGARADVYEYGQTSSAPTVTPEGTRIQYKAGQPYNVGSKEQAEQFVAAGIVEVGATFVLPDGTTGRAQ